LKQNKKSPHAIKELKREGLKTQMFFNILHIHYNTKEVKINVDGRIAKRQI
jgi:hypothetical protein